MSEVYYDRFLQDGRTAVTWRKEEKGKDAKPGLQVKQQGIGGEDGQEPLVKQLLR